jgi:hypothetical protein
LRLALLFYIHYKNILRGTVFALLPEGLFKLYTYPICCMWDDAAWCGLECHDGQQAGE